MKNIKYGQYKINSQITAQELRVIDETGANLGIMPLEAALKLAGSKELDLIEITPTVKPPVAKIISFDKFRYQKEKEFKKQKLSQKTNELKQIRFSIRTAKNDLLIKTKKIEEFLSKNHNVQIFLLLKGREKQKRDLARSKLEEFLKMVNIEYKLLNEPKFSSFGLMVQIAKK